MSGVSGNPTKKLSATRCGLRIVSCADSGFFHVLERFERNIFRVQGEWPLIIDLGLTDEQRAMVRSPTLRLKPDPGYREWSETGYIRASHKPEAMLLAWEACAEPLVHLDLDMLLTAPLRYADFMGADVAVTPRHPRERGNEQLGLDNGRINSGFVFLDRTEAGLRTLEAWRDACETSTRSDQRCLSDLLLAHELERYPEVSSVDGVKAAKLDPLVFNDVASKTGKVLHFKGLGRVDKNLRRWTRYADWLAKAPRAVRAWVHFRLMIAKWRGL